MNAAILNLLTPISHAVLGGVAIGAASLVAAQTSQPNILLILLDDAGYNDFGYMGSADLDTPRIDKLAAEGIAFRDFHVTATVCAPSRAGLMTGRYQQRFGFEGNIPPPGHGIDPAETTIAEALREVGYRSMLVGKWHLGVEAAFHPLNHGFDEFYGFLEGSRTYFPSPQIDRPRNHRAILHNYTQVNFEGYLTDVFTDRGIDFIRASKGEPFFLFMSYNAPHTPMEAKAEHLARYAGHPRATLAAMTWSVDENIGRLLDELEAQGIADNTLIFFFSDNGGAESNDSNNHPLKGWKGNKYEGGHRVPAVVSWPARLEGKRWHDGLSSALDVFPTALSAATDGAYVGGQLDGIDLLPILEGRTNPTLDRQLFWRKGEMAGMRAGSRKLVRLDGHGLRLYDLASDPGERHDLRESDAEQLSTLLADFAQWEGSLPRPLWYEPHDWTAVTWEIHYDLMNNEPVRFKTPEEMRRGKN